MRCIQSMEGSNAISYFKLQKPALAMWNVTFSLQLNLYPVTFFIGKNREVNYLL